LHDFTDEGAPEADVLEAKQECDQLVAIALDASRAYADAQRAIKLAYQANNSSTFLIVGLDILMISVA
jgi:hypothetical protein